MDTATQPIQPIQDPDMVNPTGPMSAKETPSYKTRARINEDDNRRAHEVDQALKDLEAEFNRRVARIHEDFWNDITARYGLEPGRQYAIDRTLEEDFGLVFIRALPQQQ